MFGMWDLPQNTPGEESEREERKQDSQTLVNCRSRVMDLWGQYTILYTSVYFKNVCNK